MIEAERRKLGQYWFQDGRKFAQCFQDSARCILSIIGQDGHPLSSPAGSSQRGYPVSFDLAAGSFRRIARDHRSGALAVNRPIRSSRSRWFRRQKDTTIIDANDLRISKMHAADPYSRSVECGGIRGSELKRSQLGSAIPIFRERPGCQQDCSSVFGTGLLCASLGTEWSALGSACDTTPAAE
jgi:hypothetical protein